MTCGSRDAYCEYADGHGYCFSCLKYFPSNTIQEDFIIDDGKFTYEYIGHRGLDKDTLKLYDIKTKINSEGKPVADGFRYQNGDYKIRDLGKKSFVWQRPDGRSVDASAAGLFGMDKFSSGSHKSITITEGEYDAASLHQLLRLPVVSVQSSASALRDCTVNREYLNAFERIYLCLDSDQPGQEAARRVARLFDYNRVFFVKLSKHKDANEYLQAGDGEELKNVWWNARKYLPENIISSITEFESILKEAPRWGLHYPFPTLTQMTYGIRTGETVLITAMEGVGKTELMHAIEHKILKETDDNVGAIFLEEPKRRHLQALAGLELGQPVHLPDCACSEGDILRAFKQVVGEGERLHLYSHFGSSDPDHLLDTIRFLVSACGCRYILLDHITMAVSGLGGDDERRALDYLSTRLEMMVKELDFSLILVSHVNDDGLTRGSRNISKVCDIRINMFRDLTSPDPDQRNTTSLTISKNRYAGKTGPAGKLIFNSKKYTLEEEDPLFAANDNTLLRAAS